MRVLIVAMRYGGKIAEAEIEDSEDIKRTIEEDLSEDMKDSFDRFLNGTGKVWIFGKAYNISTVLEYTDPTKYREEYQAYLEEYVTDMMCPLLDGEDYTDSDFAIDIIREGDGR